MQQLDLPCRQSGFSPALDVSCDLPSGWGNESLRAQYARHAMDGAPARNPLILRPLRLIDGNSLNLALFMGTPDLTERFSAGHAQLNQVNLAHSASLPLHTRYLTYLKQLMELQGIDPEASLLTGSGTAAVDGAIYAAHSIHALRGSTRRGIICSAAAHRSAREESRYPVFEVPLDCESQQMNEKALMQLLDRERPAAVIETVVRTDDGIIERLPKHVATRCKDEGILRIKDLSLSAFAALLNDHERFGGDSAPQIKRAYRECIAPGEFDLLASGTSKHYGVSGIAAILCSEKLGPELRQSQGFHRRSNNYFSQASVYGTTTLGAGPLVQTVRTMEALGPWRLRALALQAFDTARALAEALQDRGLRIAPVRLNSVLVKFTNEAKTDQVIRALHDRGISVARLAREGSGIRLVLPFDRVVESESVVTISDEIAAAAAGMTPAARPYYNRPTRYRIEFGHLAALQPHYVGDAVQSLERMPLGVSCHWMTSPPVRVAWETFEMYDAAQSCLAVVGAATGVDTSQLCIALQHLFAGIIEPYRLGMARRAAERVLKTLEFQPDNRWVRFVNDAAIAVNRSAHWMKIPWRRGGEPLVQEVARKIVSRTELLYKGWVCTGKPLARWDPVSYTPGVNAEADPF